MEIAQCEMSSEYRGSLTVIHAIFVIEAGNQFWESFGHRNRELEIRLSRFRYGILPSLHSTMIVDVPSLAAFLSRFFLSHKRDGVLVLRLCRISFMLSRFVDSRIFFLWRA